MNEFMEAMRDVFPQLLVQFEDFSTDNAFRYLDMFRHKYRCFNDDVRFIRLPRLYPISQAIYIYIDSRHWLVFFFSLTPFILTPRIERRRGPLGIH